MAHDDEFLALPAEPVRSAVLVLSGSSGQVAVDRARLLAAHGAAALSIRWFGGRHQPRGICEVPLETFAPALDRLAQLHDHLAIVGVSKGAEAALLLATRDPRIRAVCALAPTSVVWSNIGTGLDRHTEAVRSSWTLDGTPLPFVPYEEPVPLVADGPPAYRCWYEHSLLSNTARAVDAAIPVERITGRVVLVAGGDDQVWPSDLFAEQIRARRAAHGLPTEVITSADAGHRVSLPGEPVPRGGFWMDRGGTPQADAALGEQVWPVLRELLHLNGSDRTGSD